MASLSGLRIPCCHEQWCRLQMWLRSHIAVAVVYDGSYSSNLTPSLGTSICHRCGPKKKKKSQSYKISHRDVMYSIRNIINNIVIILYGDLPWCHSEM